MRVHTHAHTHIHTYTDRKHFRILCIVVMDLEILKVRATLSSNEGKRKIKEMCCHIRNRAFLHLVYCSNGSGDLKGKSDPAFGREQKKDEENVLPCNGTKFFEISTIHVETLGFWKVSLFLFLALCVLLCIFLFHRFGNIHIRL